MNRLYYKVSFGILKRSIILLSILYLVLTNLTYAQSWTQLTTTGGPPVPRSGHTVIYDTTNNLMTIFGGEYAGGNTLNDVWALVNANGLGGENFWGQLNPTGITGKMTTGRYGHTAIYDNNNNRMTVFGGYNDVGYGYLNDVWVLSNANGLGGTPTWTQLSPTGSAPTTRYGHTAVYDAANNRMTIFGGYNYNSYLNDVWVLSNANGLDSTTSSWTQLFPTGSAPTTRYGHTAVYDTTNNRMIIFGGIYGTYPSYVYLNDVWILSYANGLGGTPAWTQLTTVGGPPAGRAGHTAIYDNTNNRMTIFGGTINSVDYVYLNDTWVLSNANGLGGVNFWGQLEPTGSTPTTRVGHTAIYDTSNNRMTIFGGSPNLNDGYSYFLNDVWVLNNADSIIWPGPNASFMGTPLFGYSPLTVYFTDSSYNLYGDNTSWNWNFGDGSSSNIENPSHVYSTVGTATSYTVQLIVTTNYGTSTSTQNNYVIVVPQVAVGDWMLYSEELDHLRIYLHWEMRKKHFIPDAQKLE